MRSHLSVLLAVATLCLACSKTPEPTATTSPKPAPAEATTSGSSSSAAPKSPSGPNGPSEVVWEAPSSWTKVGNPSAMRKATYKIPKAHDDSEDAELSVIESGGSVDANVQRWSAQFTPPSPTKKIERKIGDLNVTIVELSGTYASGMPGMGPAGPKKNWAMLAAIVDTSPQRTFFKLTGPEKTVLAARPDFDKFVDTFKAK